MTFLVASSIRVSVLQPFTTLIIVFLSRLHLDFKMGDAVKAIGVPNVILAITVIGALKKLITRD